MNGVSPQASRLLAFLRAEGAPAARIAPFAACVAPALFLAIVTISRILEGTAGVPATPLDDSYIHFQFAKAFARGEPFAYSPGAPPVPGATSFLWPLLLSVPYAFGLHEHSIVWASWVFGFGALALLAWEARRAAEGLCSPLGAWGAALSIYAFGANTWFAASGMEVVPLAWLLLRSARCVAEWWELESDGDDARPVAARRAELVALAWALPLVRPEGMLATLLVTAGLAVRPRGKPRAFAALPALGCALPAIVSWIFTDQLASTTARAKWLPLNPYTSPAELFTVLRNYVVLLIDTLLDGRVWSALFLPEGSAPFALASLAALGVVGFTRGRRVRAVALLVIALGILIPASYDCPLCNRLRYLWPFFPAWLVGTAALAELLGEAVHRRFPELVGVAPMTLGGAVGVLAGYLHFSVRDVAESARAIHSQQVALGLWARGALPKDATIGVNDAGAISYFSERKTFDIVGLTTAGEARYWTAGAGSRFEHYERLGRARLPDYWIVYPEWFALDALLGEELNSRYVPGASILGGERMSAHVPDYSGLGSGHDPDPALALGRAVLDRMDVADLESEAAHAYQLFDAQQTENVLVSASERLDGARSRRTLDAFMLDVEPGGAIVLRVAAESALNLTLEVGARRFDVPIPASRWHEARVDLPPGGRRERASLRVGAESGTFTALHYFSLAAKPAR
jgi:hypothetical protein